MLAAALVDLDHDGAHHPRLSHCHLLLSPWHISIGSGYYMINVSAHSNMLNPIGSLPPCSALILHPHPAGVGGHVHLADCLGRLLGIGYQIF